MFPRIAVSSCILLLLATARVAGNATNVAGMDTDNSDDADPAGLIVFHQHSDGRLHLHFHLFGGIYIFLNAAHLTPPPAVTGLPSPPGRDVAVAPSPGSDTEQLVASLGSLVKVALQPVSGPCCPGRIAARTLLLPHRSRRRERNTAPAGYLLLPLWVATAAI